MCLQGEPLDAAGGEQPLALYSRPLGVTCAAKISRQQLVGFTWKAAGFDSVWQVRAKEVFLYDANRGAICCGLQDGRWFGC
jgi:hypothetical protein